MLTQTIATYQKLGCWTPHVEITRPAFEVTLDVFQYAGLITRRHKIRGRDRPAAGLTGGLPARRRKGAMTAHGNLVAGQGASGAEAFRHVRPSSLDDVVGEYTRAGAAEQGRYAVDRPRGAMTAVR